MNATVTKNKTSKLQKKSLKSKKSNLIYKCNEKSFVCYKISRLRILGSTVRTFIGFSKPFHGTMWAELMTARNNKTVYWWWETDWAKSIICKCLGVYDCNCLDTRQTEFATGRLFDEWIPTILTIQRVSTWSKENATCGLITDFAFCSDSVNSLFGFFTSWVCTKRMKSVFSDVTTRN
jgi:hypothetical protein